MISGAGYVNHTGQRIACQTALDSKPRAARRIGDPRVRDLADEIIESQIVEIEQMKLLIRDLEDNGNRGNGRLPARTVDVTPDMLPQIRELLQ